MSTVEFRGLSKYLPGAKALDSISIKAEKGKVYALLGENAAGDASGRGQR